MNNVPDEPGTDNKGLCCISYQILDTAKKLSPGYFSLVMATGIVGIACHLQFFPVIPKLLGVVNWIAFIVLTLLILIRIGCFPRRIIEDLNNHLQGPGFLTIVAGVSVLGAQTLLIEQAPEVSWWLWVIAAVLWGLIIYVFILAMAITTDKPPLSAAINGGWLLLTVSTQSVVVLGATLYKGTLVPPPIVQLTLLCLFFVGILLYLMVMTLIFYRIIFLPLTPEGFGPLYWIDTGGAAISTLAGASLMLRVADWPILEPFAPFLHGATLFIWSAAGFWLPFLIGMMIWRYLIRRDRFRYEPGLWGMVFPIGMYSSCTDTLVRAASLPFLDFLARGFAIAGLAAWLIVALFWLADLISGVVKHNELPR